MITAATFETARATVMSDELAWLNLGVIGLLIAAVSNATWLLRGRESVSFARGALIPGAGAISQLIGSSDLDLGSECRDLAPTSRRHDGVGIFATAGGLARYHHPDCPFIAGRLVDLDRREVLEGNGLLPCEVCEP
jgi:hypothetical protein